LALRGHPSVYRAVLRASATLTISAGLGLIMSLSTQATERWFLMSRHGECAEVSTLKRKVPDLGGINDPDAFAMFMRHKGYTVTSTPVSVPKGKAQEVKVPHRDLFLMFVTSDICDGSGGR
jgi:hypothetical protein